RQIQTLDGLLQVPRADDKSFFEGLLQMAGECRFGRRRERLAVCLGTGVGSTRPGRRQTGAHHDPPREPGVVHRIDRYSPKLSAASFFRKSSAAPRASIPIVLIDIRWGAFCCVIFCKIVGQSMIVPVVGSPSERNRIASTFASTCRASASVS